MVLMDNENFLSELTRMFYKARSKGSVTLTLKRYDGRNKHLPKKTPVKPPEHNEYMCLARASLGSTKISTVVHAKEVIKFQQAYVSLMRGNIDGLKNIKRAKVKTKTT